MFGVGVSIVVAVGEETNEVSLRPNEVRNREAVGHNSVSWWNISAKVGECPQ